MVDSSVRPSANEQRMRRGPRLYVYVIHVAFGNGSVDGFVSPPKRLRDTTAGFVFQPVSKSGTPRSEERTLRQISFNSALEPRRCACYCTFRAVRDWLDMRPSYRTSQCFLLTFSYGGSSDSDMSCIITRMFNEKDVLCCAAIGIVPASSTRMHHAGRAGVPEDPSSQGTRVEKSLN